MMFAGAPVLAQTAPAAPPAPETPAVTQANTATPPNASDLLFEQPQMKNVPPGRS